jgi:hypothetical protein
VSGRVVRKTEHQSLPYLLASYTLMLRGYSGPLTSSSLFPIGIIFAFGVLSLSISTCLWDVYTLAGSLLWKKLIYFITGLVWLGASKLG